MSKKKNQVSHQESSQFMRKAPGFLSYRNLSPAVRNTDGV